jgi:hypothetical protein
MAKLGVYVGTPQGVEQFESWLGRPVQQVLGFAGGKGWSGVDIAGEVASGLHGPPGTKVEWSIPMYPDGGGVAAMREVAAGLHAGDHTRWAQEVLASRAGDTDPIYIRTSWEIGGEWFAWTRDAQQDLEAYKGAFQQFSAAFHNVSGRFKIVWDFNGDRGPIEQYYPGDAAVDVISTDMYWNPQWMGTDPVNAFAWAQTYFSRSLDWMADFAAQHGKPMGISEFGVPGRTNWSPRWDDEASLKLGPQTYDSATFIQLMKAWVSTHNVEFVNYWNGPPDSGYDGRLSDGDPAPAASALRDFFLL